MAETASASPSLQASKGAGTPAAAAATTPSRPSRNPAFQAMGLPSIRARLPSRNWLVFLSITGTFFSLLSYDRYEKRRVQRKWSALVSSAAGEPLPTKMMPRKITVYLSAPPGDNLRPVRDHFKEYIKPILVAGGLDWEVVEGRREGELRAGLAERVRKLREKQGEAAPPREEEDTSEKGVQLVRNSIGIEEWNGVRGDLILGRHTWKEYIRGLHEGWLGPMAPPQPSLPANNAIEPSVSASPGPEVDGDPAIASTSISTSEDQHPSSSTENVQDKAPAEGASTQPAKPEPPTDTSPAPPYIRSDAYHEASLPSTPIAIAPSAVLPFPHLLGFLNTPIRTYRFLTRRRLADETGRQVAAIVLAARTTSFEDTEYDVFSASAESRQAIDPHSTSSPSYSDDAAASDHVLVPKSPTSKILSRILASEELDWHKSAYAPDPSPSSSSDPIPESPANGDDPASPTSSSPSPPLSIPDRPWRDPITTDPRLESLMTTFTLPPGSEKRAQMALDSQDKERAEERWAKVHRFVGWRGRNEAVDERKGWEMGLVGDDDL